ncbi:DUF255 domain-containing protein [Thiotrichales bacterium HSG1]|nr:DUF255 domain-containing protein [Thiotrichales bacterium HSG1]
MSVNIIHASSNTYSTELQKSLQTALVSKGLDYKPRTKYLLADGKPQFTNRLILESSPYLLQHAHNPVNWFAWSEEAFEQARQENKPIFLSIGYSTCHWCHVMELESFDNIEIAKIMNENFICIKVDRERRPEVDEVYMTALVLIAGHGGWPMSNFLTPEGKPFFAGTYFTPNDFVKILQEITKMWQTEQSKLIAQANYISQVVQKVTNAGEQAQHLGKEAIQAATTSILAQHDDFMGGFGATPKFPQESWLLLLLETSLRDNKPVTDILKTLDIMAQGGIYDQIGGGFHRYAVDEQWQIPHFEKMLYNQALLTRVYLQGYRFTGEYKNIITQTLDYILREMTSTQGGFYSATDADSEEQEGLFFLWTYDQINKVLNKEQAKLAIELYDITKTGNFEGKNILNLPVSLTEYANKNNILVKQLFTEVDAIRKKLRIARDKRETPLRDNKIITAWNGMMITALAEAADVLKQAHYLEAAVKAANFINSQLFSKDNLWRSYLDGQVSIIATQEDYAYFAEALITLYDVTGKEVWLQQAQKMTDIMLKLFWDETQGGFFMNVSTDKLLITRPKSPNDGAIPSGNSVAVRVLTKLANRTGIALYRNKARETINSFASVINKNPENYAYMLIGTDELLHGELNRQQYGANGKVKASLQLNDGEIIVTISIAKGWHINSNKPLQTDLIATILTLEENNWQLGAVQYPKPEQRSLQWQQEKLALYEGTIELRSKLKPKSLVTKKTNNSNKILLFKLKFQACNEKICLPPEDLALYL